MVRRVPRKNTGRIGSALVGSPSIPIEITEEKPPYPPWGRYVCDWKCTECHLFDTVAEARTFAKNWDRNCNIGWLSPVYVHGRNRKATAFEAARQISKTAKITDHRKRKG